MAEEVSPTENKYTFGLSKNVACGLIYFFGLIGGVVFLLSEKEDKDIRFCAAQSIIIFGAFTVLLLMPLGFLRSLIVLVGGVAWLVLMLQAFQGSFVRVPTVAEWADKLAQQVK